MEPVTSRMLKSATSDYTFAIQEMMRPKEDVSTLSACLMAKRAISKLMMVYLDEMKVVYNPMDSMEDLMKCCFEKDINFLQFDFSVLQCRCEPACGGVLGYCTEYSRVERCVSLMRRMKTYIFDQLKLKNG